MTRTGAEINEDITYLYLLTIDTAFGSSHSPGSEVSSRQRLTQVSSLPENFLSPVPLAFATLCRVVLDCMSTGCRGFWFRNSYMVAYYHTLLFAADMASTRSLLTRISQSTDWQYVGSRQ